MPTYEYKCPNEHYWEQQRSIYTAEPELVCPTCDEPLKKVFSAPPVNLIGDGYYRNGG